ncbi:MAG: A/G-specific adenine glycosylase [Deltaproteobacteria bacterium]|nr:A/G-specific adenine glycosylase [Deltaproteobacteria bacterium]
MNHKKPTPALLKWYDKNKRELPWRKTCDPYKIWVSEIMLQQTQVATVIPYFERFIQAFPTIEILAKSPLEKMLGLWSGLGYYRRARHLHEAAKIIYQKKYFPKTKLEWLELPGIGEYTASAIASIAFNEATAVVDGNVVRVLARVFALQGHAKALQLKKTVQAKADQLIDLKTPGDFNQAMMELGATVCTPKNPNCPQCPIKSHCLCLSQGGPEVFPKTSPKKEIVNLNRLALLIERAGNLFLTQRHPQFRWLKGMYAPLEHWLPNPHIPSKLIQNFSFVGTTQHTITHHKIITYIYKTTWAQKKLPSTTGQFFSLTEITDLPLGNLDRKIINQFISKASS